MGKTMRERRSSFGDFSEGSGRRQCVAIKRNGERCKRDAVQGVDRCPSHKGKAHAMRSAKARLGAKVRPAKPGAAARRVLAGIALADAEGVTSDRGLVDLGRKVLEKTGKV